MGRIRRSMAAATVAAMLAACGGGSAPPDTPMPLVRASATTIDASALMDWAEQHYPGYFPGHGTNNTATVGGNFYTYRAYPLGNGQTDYLGVRPDGGIYVLSPNLNDGNLWFVGTLADYTCRVVTCPMVSGTAASGAPIAGALLSVQDPLGAIVTTTTAADGSFSVRTDGLTAPFLLQLATGSGGRLYSVTADGNTATVANVTPWTDLLVRNWYGAQGSTPELAFGAIAQNPAPSPVQVQLAAQDLYAMAQLALGAAGANLSQPVDLVSMPFAADGTGIDRFLDETRVTTSATGATVVLSMPAATQTLAIGYDAAGHSVTTNSSTTNGAATTTASQTSVLPAGAAVATALQAIEDLLGQFAALVNAKGAALTAADLQPFFTTDGIQDGLTMAQYLPELADAVGQGQAVAASVRQLQQVDQAGGTVKALVHVVQTQGGTTASEDTVFGFRNVNGAWLIDGDGRIAEMSVQAEARHNQGAFTGSSGPDVNVDVRPVLGTVSNVTVTGLGNFPVNTEGPEVRPGGVELSPFVMNTGELSAPLPAAGTPVTITLTKSAGGSASYTFALNAFTTELISITSPTGTTMAAANLGSPVNVTWTLPTTYAVQRVQLDGQVFTGDQTKASTLQCIVDNNGILGPTATSGTITLPTTCGGLPVAEANISVSTSGVNGERSMAIWFLQ
jgi:hypothetical protein